MRDYDEHKNIREHYWQIERVKNDQKNTIFN